MASRLMRLLASGLIINATFPLDALAAPSPVSVAQPVPTQPFNAKQLDALLASIALYPDELLTQLLWHPRSRSRSSLPRGGWKIRPTSP